MAFVELFKVYANKNVELEAVTKQCYEFGQNIAQEPSAGMSMGLDEHALGRQRQYVARARYVVEALHARPIPDMPYTHPTRFDVDLSEEYLQFTKDEIPINEDTEYLARQWMQLAVTLVGGQSAGIAGSLIDPDYTRAVNILAVIEQYLDEVAVRPIPDVPETAFPEAELNPPRTKKK
jgi:hypothetical protein